MSRAHPRYDVVIGLEVHAQLRTQSKLFSPAPVAYGDAPNHHVSEVCVALPGVLPVLNGKAVELAIVAGLATHCHVATHSIFARKNYFYPDLPKGYQISQFEDPICTGGFIDVELAPGEPPRRIRLTRIHMEEDAGKSIHDAEIAGGDATHVDLNRAGVPLLEIVSEPDLRSPSEAAAYLRTLRGILRYVGVSDADMEKGHFRCDANVSLKPEGAEELGTRTELKNLNSFRFVEEAITAEIARQAALLDSGEAVQQATMAYDPATRRTRVLRLKENSDDYRYFPDPDLVPLRITQERIDAARAALPELATAKRARFESEYALPAETAARLAESRALADYFEAAVAAHGQARPVANWLMRDVQEALGDLEREIEDAKLAPEGLAALIRLVDEGRTNARSARGLVRELVDVGGDPEALIRERGLEAVSDSGELEAAVDAVLAEHPDDAEKFRGGEKKVLNFLMGQVMKRTQGKADPGSVRALLQRKLSG